jgi:protoporphyrinogen oxidase
VPELRYPFFRVGVYSNAVASMAPPGCSSLYVELSDRAGPIDLAGVLRGLVEVGALAAVDDVLFTAEREIEYAYVVFDDDHAAATRTIFAWLAQVGIHSCGRYGAWVYNSMEDSVIQGREAAAWATAWSEGQVAKDMSR